MYPEKFMNRMRQMLGDEFDAFERAMDSERSQALRINLKKEVKKEDIPFELEQVSWCENGFYFNNNVHPGRHPLHFAGAYYIQEPSAMSIVPFLKVLPGDFVLDLCAAPGGKSSQIAERLGPEGLLVANEIFPKRAQILSENIERMGLANVCVLNEDPHNLPSRFAGFFDKILVDAPCSGEGMFRKDEVAVEEWSEENVELCASRQDDILDVAVKLLKPGGKIVYSTCTFAPLEDEGSVERFLERHPDFVCTKQHRIWPHKDRGEGHFGAILESTLPMCEADGRFAVNPGKPGKEFEDFEREVLLTGIEKKVREGKFVKFGERLFYVNSKLPDFKGLKVVRPGLALGEYKKNRFEPDHALACSLLPSEVKNVVMLGEKEAKDYLQGLTIDVTAENGWCLVCFGNYSLGWGKVTGNTLKNHFPKGLRIQGFKE